MQQFLAKPLGWQIASPQILCHCVQHLCRKFAHSSMTIIRRKSLKGRKIYGKLFGENSMELSYTHAKKKSTTLKIQTTPNFFLPSKHF
jgi:hypothetical protein